MVSISNSDYVKMCKAFEVLVKHQGEITCTTKEKNAIRFASLVCKKNKRRAEKQKVS